MKKTYTYIIALLAMVAFQGCELESERYDVINTTVFPTTAADAEALVIGNCYTIFRASWGGIFCATTGIQITNEVTSDIGEIRDRDRNVVTYANWTTGNHWAFDSYIEAFWDWVKYISAMILTIDRISAIDMDETHKNRLIAEVQCGLGLLTYTLYDFYGPVPLPDLETLKNPLEEKILPRASEAKMQEFIETNLLAAANAPELPDVYKRGDADFGRFSKGIAHMVLLKYYMLTKQWDKAEAAGRELLDPKYGYDLVPRYKDLFTLANEKHAETIFSFNSLDGFIEQEYIHMVLTSDYPAPDYMPRWNYFRLAWWFVHTFEEGDERGQAPVLITEYTGSTGTLHSEATDLVGDAYLKYGALPLKYDIDLTASAGDSQIDYIIFRYADALTLLAEAIVRNANATTPEAIELLNRVRVRAFAGDASKAYTAGNIRGLRDFLDKLMAERAKELYWEGCRRQDLIRDGKYVERMTWKAQNMGESTMVNENYARFPIPQTVINEGKGVILQNPGY